VSIHSREEVYSLLQELGATKRLITHLKLVGETSESICAKLNELGVAFDQRIMELGVAVHDARKILVPAELDCPGNDHEPAGQELLLQNGIPPEVARCCISHGRSK
jgi:hypothetical protein